MPRVFIAAWAGLVIALTASPAVVFAKPAPKKSSAEGLAELSQKLRSGEREAALAAAKSLGAVAGPQKKDAAGVIVRALAVGVAPEVASAALDALASIGEPTSFELLARYCHHRRPAVRSHALAAVVALFPKRGEPLVVAALGDRSQDVRVAAASIAAERKLKSAIAPLLSLLRRGAVEAIAPLGQLADAEVARQVAELISVVEDSLVAQALGAMLLNPAFGPDPVRVEVVFALAGMPGDESVKVLKKYVDAVPEQPHRESRDEAVIAIDKRVSGGGR